MNYESKVKEDTISITKELKITNEDIDDIVSTALEGGINYWCSKASVIGEYLGEYASDQISRGGELILKLREPVEGEPDEYVLSREKLLNGIKAYLLNPNKPYNIIGLLDKGELYLETANVDAEVADMIIQYAIFNEIVFG